jgi:thiol-disulfide isomerase/thioredoxin
VTVGFRSMDQNRLTLRPIRRFGIALAVALVAAGCGSTDDDKAGSVDVETGARPTLERASASATSPLPDVALWDVTGQDWVQFANLVPAEKPIMLWFWAPHCPACAAEAPNVKAFAEAHGDKIDVIGLGTQDDATMAAEFVERHGIPFTMLWDETFESWTPFGVRSQPSFIVLDRDGNSLGGWTGGFPEDEVVDLVS